MPLIWGWRESPLGARTQTCEVAGGGSMLGLLRGPTEIAGAAPGGGGQFWGCSRVRKRPVALKSVVSDLL